MSRIGMMPIEIPTGVEVTVDDKNFVSVKGPLGKLGQQIVKEMNIRQENNTLIVSRPTNNKRHKSLHGLSRTLIANMVNGVVKGYEKRLEIVGVGYRAKKEGKKLILSLGYSHPVEIQEPDEITVEVPKQTSIIIKGIDKQRVGNYAAKIREKRKPEPYKGKGVRYEGEVVRRKEGKTGK
ncbi:MAG: 50S ribosomal protein L6 [Clostridiales bacterium]|nr:50S ribosomal protein L6 [Clostridiales bacterium]